MRKLYLLFVGAALIAPLTGCHTTRPNACGPVGCGANSCGAGCQPGCHDGVTTGQCDCNRDYNPLDPYNKCGINRPPHLNTRQAGAAGYGVGIGTTGTPITGVLPQPVSPHPVLSSPSPAPMIPAEPLRESPREFPGREK